jgi:hypothetical protein
MSPVEMAQFYYETEQMIHERFKTQWMQAHVWKRAVTEIRSLYNCNPKDWNPANA